MKDNSEQQEETFKKIVLNIYNDVDIPDNAQSWKKAQEQLRKRRRRIKWANRAKVTSGIVAVSLFINLALNLNMPVTYADFSSLFREAKNQMIQIFFQDPNKNEDNSHAKTPPPVEGNETNSAVPEQTTLDDAKSKLMFSLRTPEYVPDGYRLDIVRIFREAENEYRNAFLEYINESGDLLKMNQQLIAEHSGSVKTDIAEGAGEIKELAIDGAPAVLVVIPDGSHYLEWLTKDMIVITVSGKVSEEDIIKFAESLH
ncbi:DUF4367 domain-containing protein [Paenibacillus oenotherae]|uniref:DUF4367 domain-containing protein n=1 Tax=Paenibacillus oenotherae TaxID=1435645 RepID=A0ABS7DBI7_9BACL|nr:DUF4367 domain-containing protein [Paenibacillus oenotherae]MBW7477250.1 DUF4367 domain-containing protein [Paenibacillus oenotherae]